MIRAVVHSEPIPPTHGVRDLYVLPYGSSRWTIKFRSGLCMKLYKNLDDAIEAAFNQAKKYGSEVFLEDLRGNRKKVSVKTM